MYTSCHARYFFACVCVCVFVYERHKNLHTCTYAQHKDVSYCHSHNNRGALNGFERFLVPVYYWETAEKPETDPQLLSQWRCFCS